MNTILAPRSLGGYPILIGRGLLPHLGNLLAEQVQPGSIAVVSDRVVANLYADCVLASLQEGGFHPFQCTISGPPGEAQKNLATVTALYERFLDGGLDRGDCVLALGGGTVGDVAGFAAATYLRGVPLVHVPTTLLGMVDSSLGGKVGVNLARGKNLVGAFKQPVLVVSDLDALVTLPPRELRSAYAEIVKTAMVGDADLFAHLERSGPEPLDEVVAWCVKIKLAFVARDPEDHGERQLLNLGHTFAHALEIGSAYQLNHGEAVSVGLALAAGLSARLELCPPELVERVNALLERLGLPTTFQGVDVPPLLATMAHDKKQRAGKLQFVLPFGVGEARLVSAEKVPEAALVAALEAQRR
jgi:3-dehydroquinate synthase